MIEYKYRINIKYSINFPNLKVPVKNYNVYWSNDLVVKALDSQSMVSEFKTSE